MGFSTPKEPFDLKAFLSVKGVPRSKLRPQWKRRDPLPPPTAGAGSKADEDETSAD